MSGHGKREARLRVDATAWRDRVIDDVLRGKGRASARAPEISVDVVIAGAELIQLHLLIDDTEQMERLATEVIP